MPDIRLDADRAAVHVPSGSVVIADLHLGYEWVQRARGQMVPLGRGDDTACRLGRLVRRWGARRVVVLGDMVHGMAGWEGVREALVGVLERVRGVEWRVVLGNHDRGLAGRLGELGVGNVSWGESWQEPGWVGVHGDHVPWVPHGERVLSGHEHPAVNVGRAGMGEVRVPAFVVGERGIILPAFSAWAGGSLAGRRRALGEWARGHAATTYVACMGSRLLAIPAARLAG